MSWDDWMANKWHHNSISSQLDGHTHTRTKQKNTIYSISRSMDVFMGTYWRFEKPEPKKIDIWRLYSITDNNIFIWHRSDFYLTAYAVYEPFYIGKWNLICFANVAKKNRICCATKCFFFCLSSTELKLIFRHRFACAFSLYKRVIS